MPRKTDRVIPFSQKAIDSLPFPSSGRVEWWDEQTPNLTVRITANGSRSFYWIGRNGRKFCRVLIGPYPGTAIPRARDEAKRLSALAADGKTPTTSRQSVRDEWTLQELFDWYLETISKPHKRTWKWDSSQYTRVLSQWSSRRVSAISRGEVQELHVKLGKDRGPYAANKMLELLGHMVRTGKIHHPSRVTGDDPTRGIKRFPRLERERFLSADEIERFFAAVDKLQRQVSRDFLMLCLWTGARRGNVMSMRWDEIDLAEKVWTIPAAKSKSKRLMRIPLSVPAIEILTRLDAEKTSAWVLNGQGPTGHYNDPKAAWTRVKKLAKLVDVRIHDLRRTLGSWMAVNSPLQIVGKQLGHSSLKSTSIYARLATQTVKDAADDAANRMLGKK